MAGYSRNSSGEEAGESSQARSLPRQRERPVTSHCLLRCPTTYGSRRAPCTDSTWSIFSPGAVSRGLAASSSRRTSAFLPAFPTATARSYGGGSIQIFLAEKSFEGLRPGLELTDEIKVTIATQACLLLLHRQTDVYPRLVTILVYPTAYHARAHEVPGVALEGNHRYPCESWSSGVVVLSWDDVRGGASDIRDGQNLVASRVCSSIGSRGRPRSTALRSWASVASM